MFKRISGWMFGAVLLIGFSFLLPEPAAAEEGWVQEGGQYFYYENDESVKGWKVIDGKWYYFSNDTGIMRTGWLKEGDSWYFLKSTGAMHTGWLSYGGKWYFMQKNGEMKTGWLYDSYKWYYLDGKSGVIKTGWINDEGTWYFLSDTGVMKTGWYKHSGTWYYLGKNGAMKTGWLYDSYKWYYLDEKSGAMKTGWLKEGGKWYYLEAGGAMKTGWLQENGRWYFLNRSGIMQTGWIWFGHEWNYFKDDGVWVKNTIVDEMESVWEHDQIILVTSNGYSSYNAKIRTYEKVDGKWYERMNISGFLGKYGFADVMKEGGKESPRGKYSIGTAFGRYENPGTKLPYQRITSDDVWVDDPSSNLYNTWQKASANNGQWNSAEKMDIPLYNYGFVINYNTEKRVPGAGSAIFFHVGTNYTLGCTATSQNQVISILKWLDPAKNPAIIQTPESELGNY
ncbi:L,D-transpeptidase family protein [Mesobacillus sp. LC4]